jgi:Core-2/I-Branching enzyme
VTDPRIGVLVLGAHSPEVLELLLRVWRQPRFFIHIDAKADISRSMYIANFPNAEIIADRYPVFWGGWNMVRAELALMRRALAAGCDRLLLISDDSFPLRRYGAIAEAMAGNELHLGLWEMPESDPAHVRYRQFFYFDSVATGYRSHDIYQRFITDTDIEAMTSLSSLKRRGKAVLPMLYKGPQWWCLTGEAAAYVLDVHAREEHLRESFRFSLIPDEHFIHTVIGLSTPAYARKAPPMWSDITRNPSPWIFRDITELEQPLASEQLFVRKVAPSLAEQLARRWAQDG